jgi:hypothetical protein
MLYQRNGEKINHDIGVEIALFGHFISHAQHNMQLLPHLGFVLLSHLILFVGQFIEQVPHELQSFLLVEKKLL